MEAKKHNFEREKCIGKGTYGKVFLCFDKNERQKKFAMKVIDLEGSPEDERNLAEKEANLLTTLQHKYILHALETFQEKETLCIVTEFCDQGNLEQFLNKRKGNLLEERQIVEWFRQICSALKYLHGRNILHRDIKTQNIFLTGKEMTIKLGDLGLAKVLESSIQKASTFCGSLHYISPEILACKPYNSKSDIWAMGVCVYEMTTLRRPFDSCLPQQLCLKIAEDQLPPLPEGYSRELIEIIERMLCRDTDRRPSALELLQDALFKNREPSTLKVQHFLQNEKTTRGNSYTNGDMDKTISDNTLKINFNANREYDNYPSCRSTVSNSESFEASTSDKPNGSETSLEHENYFDNTITDEKSRSTFQPPSSTFTIIRSLFTSFKRSVMGGTAGSDGQNSISSRPKRDKEIDIFQELKEDCVLEDEKGASVISEENWHPPSYIERQDSEAVLQQEFYEFKEGKEDEKDEEERTLMDEKVKRRFQSQENNRKPENVRHGKPRSGRPRPGIDRPYDGQGTGQSNDRKGKERRKHAQNHWVEYKPGEKNSAAQNAREMKKDDRKHKNEEKKFRDSGLPDERDKYKYFWRNRSVFSQWYSCYFKVDGKTYNCTEQYMMHQKAVLMDDMERADIIMALDDPREMKQQGRYVKNFDQKIWDKCCQDVVERGNTEKFLQNEELKEELLRTFPRTLVEASPMDRIWGIGLAKEDHRAWNKQTWRGQNLLGKVLTRVRNNIMEEQDQEVGRQGGKGPVKETTNKEEQEEGRMGQKGSVKETMNEEEQEVGRKGGRTGRKSPVKGRDSEN